MKANYHTHTWRCMHAAGQERAYIERAIEGGLSILGFSDHTPYPFPGGYESNFRMRVDQLEDYVTTISELREEYKRDIEIHIGLEAEYYPLYFQKLLDLVSQYPVEYFLLGQHFVGNETDGTYSGAPTQDADVLKGYVNQVIEALKTGRFTYLAHPDLIHYVGDTGLYEEEMRKLCVCAKELHIPLEVNLLGVSDGRNYPNPRFWKTAGEVGCNVIIGADAHNPMKVWDPSAQKRAREIAEANGLCLLETAVLRDPVRLK